MSKRAEEAALKAYPAPQLEGCSNILYDLEGNHREGFVNGYEQAEKDTIERTITWLKEHINDYIVKGRDIDFMFDDLKKAMEEEK